jgi:hypothetical protein
MKILLNSTLFQVADYNITFSIKSNGVQLNFIVKAKLYKMLGYFFLGLGALAILVFTVSLPMHKMLGV